MVSPLEQLQQLYQGLDEAVTESMKDQAWWPCLNCPVARVKSTEADSNCCHHALFFITKTEWDRLKQSPYVQEHRRQLIKSARRTVHQLKSAGYNTDNWSEVVSAFATEAKLFTCPLLNEETGLCQVYGDRPTICRAYGVTQTDAQGIYGCRLTTQATEEHGGAVLVPTTEVLDKLAEFSEPPVKPIVGWLADEKM